MNVTALVLLASLAASQSRPQSAPTAEGLADLPAVQKALRCVSRIAAVPRERCVTFAAALADCFKKHGLAVPKGAASTPAPEPGDLADFEREQVASAVKDLIEACSSARAATPEAARSLYDLSRELLMAIAMQCPHADSRVQAAKLLADWVLPSLDRPLENCVPPQDALKAVESAFDYAMSVAIDRTDRWPGTLAEWNVIHMLPRFASLSAIAAGKPTSDEFTKAIDQLMKRIEAAKNSENTEAYADFVSKARKAVLNYEDKADDDMDEQDTSRRAIPLCRDYFAAVAKGDKEAAKKFLTGKTAEKATSASSLRSLHNLPESGPLSVYSVSTACKGDKTSFRIEVNVQAVGVDGKTFLRHLILPLKKSKDGTILIGE